MTDPNDAREQREDPPTQRQRPIPADTFAVRLAIARMHAGHLTIREAAETCGLNYGSWSNWENGSKPRDLLEVAYAVSEGLDVDHSWLLFGGPLAGPHGMPTGKKKARSDQLDRFTTRYREVAAKPRGGRPNGRPSPGQRPGTPPRPEQRRPVRISRPSAAYEWAVTETRLES